MEDRTEILSEQIANEIKTQSQNAESTGSMAEYLTARHNNTENDTENTSGQNSKGFRAVYTAANQTSSTGGTEYMTTRQNNTSNDAEFATSKYNLSSAGRHDDSIKQINKPVTRKFLAIALAATIFINAGITAGVVMLTNKSAAAGGPSSSMNTEMSQGGGPGPGGNGQMTPPDMQNNGQAPSQPGSSDSSDSADSTNTANS